MKKLFPVIVTLQVISLVLAVGCPAAKDEATFIKDGVVDCAKAQAAKAVAEFAPMAEQVITRATDGTGKIDWPSIEDATANLKEAGWCAVEVAMSRLLAHVAKAGGVMSSGVRLDAEDAQANLARLRAQRFGNTKFEVH